MSWRDEYEGISRELEKKGIFLKDKDWRLNSGVLYKIQDKAGKTIPFKMTDIQKVMWEDIRGDEVRSVILKGRQIMCTTLVMLSFLDDCLFEDNMEARTIADDEETIEKLFKRVKFAYDHLPKFLHGFFPLDASNKYEIKIRNRNSHYKVCLSTHGDTVRRLHFSEVAFIQQQHVNKRVAESLETVPQGIGKTKIVFESIANGGDGLFADLYRQAKAGESEYKSLFFEWFKHHEYTVELDSVDKETIRRTLNAEEKKLVEEKGLSLGQIAWRRMKIRSIATGATYEDKLEVFKVKYPENDKDCFLLTGKQVFSQRLIAEYKENKEDCVMKPKKIFGFNMLDCLVENSMGDVFVYNEPEAGGRYVLGGDVSDGTTKGDRSRAFVLEVGTSRIMAYFKFKEGKPETFGSRCATLGRYYNDAEIAIETNFRDSCVKEILRGRYPNVYYHGKEEGKRLSNFGWNTNERSKRLIIDQFKYDFETKVWEALPYDLLDEMEHYVELHNGKTEASPGHKDDSIMSFSIANYLALKLPSYKQRKQDSVLLKEYNKTLKGDINKLYNIKRKGVNDFNVSGV